MIFRLLKPLQVGYSSIALAALCLIALLTVDSASAGAPPHQTQCFLAVPSTMAVLRLRFLGCPRREVNADVLVFRNTDPPSGAIKPTVITMEPGQGQYLGISFFESQIGSAGEQWRSSAWTAIASSSFLLGEDLNQYRFSFDAEGGIDGPSAGGLFTSSTLALILGENLQREVTMTGTINPDGSIGPVGGIPLKVRAAHEQGKRRVVIPAGQLTPELQTMETELGIDVEEATNIYQAYELLTGQPLPLPIGFEDVRPQMASAGSTALQTLIEDVHVNYERQADRLTKISIPEEMTYLQRDANADFLQSQQALKQGDLPQAYATGRDAYARILLVENLIDAKAAINDFSEKPWNVSVFEPLWETVEKDGEALLQTLNNREVNTANDAVVVSRAFGHLILAKGLKDLTAEELMALRSSQAARDPESELYRRALFYSAVAPVIATVQLQQAEDALQLGQPGQGRKLQYQELSGFVNTLNTAATAGIAAFESLTIRPLADSGAEAFEVVAEDFKSKDISYFLALAALNSKEDFIDLVDDPDKRLLANLGASQTTYVLSGELISQYYSLKASYDPKLEQFGIRSPIQFENQRALINMLDLAEIKARGDIAMAERAGNEVTQQIVMYEQGKFLREGNPADKVTALRLLWTSSLEARLLTILSGQFKLQPQSTLWGRWLPWIGGGLLSLILILGWLQRSSGLIQKHRHGPIS